ncbi:hypothetical protein DER46DRAFT_616194 [Fusarium sp. MPI-SDFR-AT-0072]|nr:hypothetical protein DER46DRAFT_616194 [Fusarium sp. MPI-SDFR-AT-0072]
MGSISARRPSDMVPWAIWVDIYTAHGYNYMTDVHHSNAEAFFAKPFRISERGSKSLDQLSSLHYRIEYSSYSPILVLTEHQIWLPCQHYSTTINREKVSSNGRPPSGRISSGGDHGDLFDSVMAKLILMADQQVHGCFASPGAPNDFNSSRYRVVGKDIQRRRQTRKRLLMIRLVPAQGLLDHCGPILRIMSNQITLGADNDLLCWFVSSVQVCHSNSEIGSCCCQGIFSFEVVFSSLNPAG